MSVIYFFVEGDDDRRFIERIVKPLVTDKGYVVYDPYKYAQEKPENVKDCYRNMKKFCKVCFLADFNNSPCITARKKRINKKYSVDFEDIVVVKPEIEAWYLAGVTDSIIRSTSIPKSVRKRFKKLGLPNDCENITKEDFNRYIPKGIERSAFMSLILDYYDLKIAVTKNKSLNRFITKVLGVKV
ncbi:hypothetical protein [Archaeoglobus sp.]